MSSPDAERLRNALADRVIDAADSAGLGIVAVIVPRNDEDRGVTMARNIVDTECVKLLREVLDRLAGQAS